MMYNFVQLDVREWKKAEDIYIDEFHVNRCIL